MAHITYLTLIDFEIICTELKHFFKKNNDPLPNFKESYFDKLDSVITTPVRTFDGADLYKSIFEKAACYFYFIIKLHPFSNANKRISIVSTGVFLLSNGYTFTAEEDIMYTFAKRITLSKKVQQEEFGEVIEFIKTHSTKSNQFEQPKFIKDILVFLQKIQFRPQLRKSKK